MNNRPLKLLFLSNGIFALAMSLLGPLYAVYVQNLGKGVLTISTSWAVFLLSATLFTFLISRLGDKYRKDYLLMAGFLIRALVWLSFIFISSISELIALQVLLGLGEALGTPSFEAIFAEHLDKNKHIEEYADWQLLQDIVGALGVLGGGFLVDSYGFKVLFYIMATLAIISFFMVLFKPKKVAIQ